jgi:cyclopropane-fatty-acyl-phospholipid synthase
MKKALQYLFDQADVKIDGKRPWDIQVNNQNLYPKILAGGSLALGETYMDGWWECEAIDQFIDRLVRLNIDTKVKYTRRLIWNTIKARIINQQSRSKALVVGERHYDIGNELYKNMLDKRLTYSCAYWKDAETLDEAQEAKLDLICKKLKLEPGMTMLDIGCGWGSLAKFAAENYQVKVTGITISKEQVVLAKEFCSSYDIEIRLQDYRDVKEQFDRVVSVGMIEHVGYKNYKRYMRVVRGLLEDDGLFLLHTIGGNTSVTNTDPWIDKYIFPNSMLPSASQLTKAAEGNFQLQDWHNFGIYYDKTLMAWHKNFNENWHKIKTNYDERFRRMWNYYLLSCAGTFRAHKNQLWQIVFSKIESQVEYESVRNISQKIHVSELFDVHSL